MKARELPHDNAAEQAVLGGMMLDPRALAAVAGLLELDDFFRRDHRALFRALLDLNARGTPCDAVTVGEWLEANHLSEIIKVTYVLQLANSTPSAANIRAYAAIVREKAVARRAIDAGSRLIEAAYSPTAGQSAGEIIDTAVRELMTLHRVTKSTEWTMRQAVEAAWQHAVAAHEAGGLTGIPSGLEELDERLGGWQDSDLIVIAGRPKMGKTAFLLGTARHAAARGLPIGIISGEQAMRQIGARVLSLESSVRASGLRNGKLTEDEWGRLYKAVPSACALPVFLDDNSRPTLTTVRRTARRWKQDHNIRALYVDYLQKIKTDEREENRRIAAAAEGLKELARELDMPVIVLAQVKQDVEQRQDKRPRASDIYGSDAALKEADIAIFLYRDKVYNPNSNLPDECELLVEANRHGPAGSVSVPWHPETMRFGGL